MLLKMTLKNLLKRRAFSLIEVSVVLVIIGIFIAGIFASNAFITKARLAAAQSLLKSSPIRSIKANALWLETGALDSFADSEASDGTPLTTWYEQRSATSKVTLTAVDGGPTYSNTINRIHAVKFAGAGYFTFDGSFLNNTDYTITILEKREASGGNNYFLGDSAATTTNQSLLLGYSADGQIIHSQGASSSYSALVSGYFNSSDTPRLLTFTHSSTAGKKLYINGVLAAKDETNLAPLTGIGTLSFGKGYTGQIGELAIFTRAIGAEEIKSVEGYIAQKFSLKLVGNASTTDCLGKVVTASGCEAAIVDSSTCTVSVVGVTSTTPVVAGNGSLTCDAANFNGGTISYNCSGVVLTPASNCQCATGYGISGSTCILPGCSGGTETIVGSNKIHTFTSSGSLTCTGAISGATVLVVGGGGGGGFDCGGGGGGGQVVSQATTLNGTITINIGDGGAAGFNRTSDKGSLGGNSSITIGSTTITAKGGNGAVGRYTGNYTTGGHTGGGGGYARNAVSTGFSGFNGGNGGSGGGGGGGAGGAGTNAPGNGGTGVSSLISGSSTCYGGGGGGCTYPSNSGGIATCGGGGGLYTECTGNNGTNGLGGGGSAMGACGAGIAGKGGSGVVIIKYTL